MERCRLLAIWVEVGVEKLVKLGNSGCVCLRSLLDELGGGATLDGPGSSANIVRIRKVIDMVAHRHEQVEEDFPPHLHLHLHGTTTLEGLTTANNQGEVVSAQSRITVWRVVVRVTC